jgi:hypothetical protein
MNIERFDRVLNHIIAHPETWEQGDWHTSCYTAHCFAGHAEVFASRDELFADVRFGQLSTRDIAEKYLEISHLEGWYLFNSDRTIEDFKLISKRAHERGPSHDVSPFFGMGGEDLDGNTVSDYERSEYARRVPALTPDERDELARTALGIIVNQSNEFSKKEADEH